MITRSGRRSGSGPTISPCGGLVPELAGHGLTVDYHSVGVDLVHAEKLSLKKAWWLASAIDAVWRGGEPSGKIEAIGLRRSITRVGRKLQCSAILVVRADSLQSLLGDTH